MNRCGVATPSGFLYPPPAPRRAHPALASVAPAPVFDLPPAAAVPVAMLPPPPSSLDPWSDAPLGSLVRWEPNARLAAKGRAAVEGTLARLGRGTTTRFARIESGGEAVQVWENQGELRVLAAASPAPPRAPSPARHRVEAPPRSVAAAPEAAAGAPPGKDRNVFVCLKPTPEAAAEIAKHAKVPAADLHLTLAFLGRESALGPGGLERVRDALAALARERPAVVGETAAHTETFPGGAQYLPVLGDAIPHLREAVVGAVGRAGASVDASHAFVPHVTLDPAAGPDAAKLWPSGVVLPFLDLWLCSGRSRCERIPLARPDAAERVARSREALRSAVRSADAARGRGGWRSQRASVGWAEKAARAAETLARMERSYGMVPGSGRRELPSPTSVAPGMREPRPLRCAASWPKPVCAALPKAVRLVESILPVLKAFPDAARAVAAVRRAVESGEACADAPYARDAFEADVARSNGVESVALAAVDHLSHACRSGNVSTYAADSAADAARDVADFLRGRAASPPIDFSAALGEDGRGLGANPTLSLAPDPTPAEAAAAVVDVAASSLNGRTLTPADLGGSLPSYPPAVFSVWQAFRRDPREARRRAEADLVSALGAALRRARRVESRDVPDERGYVAGAAVDAVDRLDALRLFELAAEAGVSSPAAAAYPAVVERARARRAEVEAELAQLGPRAARDFGDLARACREVAARGGLAAAAEVAAEVAARPEFRRTPAAAEVAAVRDELLRIASALEVEPDLNDVAALYEGSWVWYGRGGRDAPLPESQARHRKPLEAILDAHVVGPASRAAREAIARLAPFAERLESLRAEHHALADERIAADPWAALYGRHAPTHPTWERVFRSVTRPNGRRRADSTSAHRGRGWTP